MTLQHADNLTSLHGTQFLCDLKTNQHVLIFPSDSSETLLPTSADHFTQTSLALVQNQQILIIKSELILSFIKGPGYRHPCYKACIKRQTHLVSDASQLILQVTVNSPAKLLAQRKNSTTSQNKNFLFCLSVHLYVHQLGTVLLTPQPAKSLKIVCSTASSSRPPFAFTPCSLPSVQAPSTPAHQCSSTPS